MNKQIQNIEPKEIWSNFVKINAISRASKKEEALFYLVEKQF